MLLLRARNVGMRERKNIYSRGRVGNEAAAVDIHCDVGLWRSQLREFLGLHGLAEDKFPVINIVARARMDKARAPRNCPFLARAVRNRNTNHSHKFKKAPQVIITASFMS